jgi:hypothetical protein
MRAKDFIVERDTLMGQPDPVIVISDSNGKQLDKLAMSVAAKKYGFNIAQIRPQFKHQDKVKHKQYTLSAPISGQPMESVEQALTEEQFDEAAGKKDACYHKVKSRYKVWPSAYASGALVKCRKVGAANWGNKSKK